MLRAERAWFTSYRDAAIWATRYAFWLGLLPWPVVRIAPLGYLCISGPKWI